MGQELGGGAQEIPRRHDGKRKIRSVGHRDRLQERSRENRAAAFHELPRAGKPQAQPGEPGIRHLDDLFLQQVKEGDEHGRIHQPLTPDARDPGDIRALLIMDGVQETIGWLRRFQGIRHRAHREFRYEGLCRTEGTGRGVVSRKGHKSRDRYQSDPDSARIVLDRGRRKQVRVPQASGRTGPNIPGTSGIKRPRFLYIYYEYTGNIHCLPSCSIHG